MTSDPFTEAARAEAERQYPALNPDAEELTYPRSALREHRRSAHVAGWEAARTYLAAQEPTGAEVLAALNAQGVVVSPKMHPAPSLDYWGDKPVEAMRAALSAARAARRDEGDR